MRSTFQPHGELLSVHVPGDSSGKKRGFGFVEYKNKQDAQNAIEKVNSQKICSRVVAVDWCLPQTQFLQQLEESQQLQYQEGEDEDEKDEAPAEYSPSEHPEPPKVSRDIEEGQTIFVRNVPFTASEEALKKVFSKYGKVVCCLLVKDKVTEQPMGTAFVRYRSSKQVDRLLASAYPFEGDQQQGQYSTIFLDARPLQIFKAVDRTTAQQLRAENLREERKKKKHDKRNLYLAEEGFIKTNSDAAKGLSREDLARRLKAEKEKKAKLKNPNYHVSTTRLSIRNLPLKADEKLLKEKFLSAAATANVSFKPKVLQVKIARDSSRITSDGHARSKGYGFVEFKEHIHALTALRAINNNPDIFGKSKRPIVEFALEDMRKVRLHKMQVERAKKRKVITRSKPPEGNEAGNMVASVAKAKRGPIKDSLNLRNNLPPHSSDSLKTQLSTPKNVSTSRKKRSQKADQISSTLLPTASPQANISDGADLAEVSTVHGTRKPPRRKKRSRVMQEEQKFESMLSSYKRALSGESLKKLKQSRWFET